MDLRDSWIDFIKYQVSHPATHFLSQRRKFVQGLIWKVPGDIWNSPFPVEPPNIGYSKGMNTKFRQLTRVYFNKEGFDILKESLHNRILHGKEQSAISVPTINGTKDSRSQGHCIRNVTVSYFDNPHPRVTIDFDYRITELIKKFGADIFFLKSKVVPYLMEGLEGVELECVRFYFANTYFSLAYLPAILRFWNVIDYLNYIRNWDEPLFKASIRVIGLALTKPRDHYGYKDRRIFHHIAIDLAEEGIIPLKETLEYIEQASKEHGMIYRTDRKREKKNANL